MKKKYEPGLHRLRAAFFMWGVRARRCSIVCSRVPKAGNSSCAWRTPTRSAPLRSRSASYGSRFRGWGSSRTRAPTRGAISGLTASRSALVCTPLTRIACWRGALRIPASATTRSLPRSSSVPRPWACRMSTTASAGAFRPGRWRNGRHRV